MKEQDYSWFKKLQRTKKCFNVGNIGTKDDILKVQEKLVALVGNKTKRSLGMK